MDDEIIQIDYEKDGIYDVDNSRDPHSGKQVSLVSLSPNGKYVVTYSRDDESIEGWVVEDSKLILDPKASVYKLPKYWTCIEIKVNDSKIVYFGNIIYESEYVFKIFRMSNENQQIKLNPLPPERWQVLENINFKKNGDLILSNRYEISMYDKELSLVSFYELSSLLSDNEIIKEVLIDDENIWVITLSYLFHWDLKTVQLKFSYSLGFTTTYKNENTYEKSTVITKGNSIAVNYSNEIAIFLKDDDYPIRNIQLKGTNIKIEFCEVQNNVYLLAFNIPEKDEEQDIILYNITDINKQPIDASMIFKNHKFILYKYNSESKEAFGLVDGKFPSVNLVNLPDLNLHEFFESHKEDDDLVGWNDYLGQTFEKYYYNDTNNDTLAFLDMENIRSLLSEPSKNIEDLFSDEPSKNIEVLFSDEYENKNIATKDINFNNQKYKWRIELKNDKLDKLDEDELGKLDKLSVYSDKEELLCSKDIGIKFTKLATLNWKSLNNNALALRFKNYYYGESIIIYEHDIHNKHIKTRYFNYGLNIKDFFGPILPIMDIKNIADLKEYNIEDKQYFTHLSEIIISIIKDERCLAKYGPTLLPNLIKSTDPKLTHYIEKIYNKCIKLVKEDPIGNVKFLNTITSSMNYLYEKYPDYITKFNSEMFMISFDERIEDNYHSHFNAFSHKVEIRKVSQSIKYIRNIIRFIKNIFRFTASILILPFTIIYLMVDVISHPREVSSKMLLDIFSNLLGNSRYLLHFIYNIFYMKQSKQQIVLIVPYIGFCHYPFEYSWWKEIFYPQSSVFTDTCKKEFYTNWNGEAIINFKWKKFGMAYYIFIWSIFMVFLVCFTIASYPTNSITQEIRIKLYQSSIAFGFYHLLFELRQYIWNPKKYVLSIWNLFDLSAYLSATIASIYWIKYDDIPDWALSISCLLLDLKFLLFFRAFKSFGIYFALIFGVAYRVFSFLVVLAIIIASFAHAFFLLLHPQNLLDPLSAQNPNDPNNPWTLSNTYNQVDENGNILKETLIQVPSENTNLFFSYPTSLLATYLFLTGNR
ncbi:hypothetical protein RirG_040820 [Rhizophagus irregularis DAOM 197198w]|uniref:Ion transport domain-containing protein n=2 Tax=Rhizophagus irregularis TaxID=588596 RepID=A0A015N8P8_RHIIW|nr:hypothetical protein RirG_040820 [Rhizophagus irregularis DAOM 197198w]